jgi:hypothetical protein
MRKPYQFWLLILLGCLVPGIVRAQTPTAQGGGSFMVQCPNSTAYHPTIYPPGSPEPAYTGSAPVPNVTLGGVTFNGADNQHPAYIGNGGQIKCQQISGGDGFMTEADGNQTFMFSFGPLSGIDNIKHGLPGTLLNTEFNGVYCVNSTGGQTPCNWTSTDIRVNGYYNSPVLPSVCGPGAPPNCAPASPGVAAGAAGIVAAAGGNAAITDPTYDPSRPTNINAGVRDPATIMTLGVLNGNIPAPLIAFDEDDEFFLTLSNVGMIMRPDLFEQHTVHFHGYPNASSYYDGVPDASWAINIGGSATYYYLAPDAGTYFWHCHITPPEHLQMGMVGQLYVRPRQNRVPQNGTTLYHSLQLQQNDQRTACNTTSATNQDILCSVPMPPSDNGVVHINDSFGQPTKYAYNDGDGSTRYDIDVPIQIHGFDPNFHFVGMTFNPEGFADMKNKYFLLNGRSYPDTVGIPGYAGGPTAQAANTAGSPDVASNAIGTEDSDGRTRFSQPLPTLITLDSHGGPGGTGQRALLRIADLDVTEYQTLASLGIPMQLIGFQAKLLRDQAGNNMYVTTNSITIGGGESLDVILDSTGIAPGTYFLYTPNLDHLSNDAENFGGLMTEVVVQ